VQPYDKGMVSAIEKAIRTSGTGLNPMSDGTVVRADEDHQPELFWALADAWPEETVGVAPPVASSDPSETDWLETDWQHYDWRAAASLGESAEREASNAWAIAALLRLSNKRTATAETAKCPLRFRFQLWLTRTICFWINFDFIRCFPFWSSSLLCELSHLSRKLLP